MSDESLGTVRYSGAGQQPRTASIYSTIHRFKGLEAEVARLAELQRMQWM